MQNKEIEEALKEMNIIITTIREILEKDVKITDEEVYTLDGRQYLAIENLLQYIDQLENKVKEKNKIIDNAINFIQDTCIEEIADMKGCYRETASIGDLQELMNILKGEEEK